MSLLDTYLPNLNRVRINTLDSLCRSISAGEGGICIFGDCLGDYLAIAPDGGIYPCQRFAGRPAFCLGHVQDQPTPDQLTHSPVWQLFRQREERVAEECGDCPYFAHCKGGCPYNALAAGGGLFRSLRDPYCPAYRRIFAYITERALEKVFSKENLSEVVARPADGTLLRRSPLLTLLRGDPHPHDVAPGRRRIESDPYGAAVWSAHATRSKRVNELQIENLIHALNLLPILKALPQINQITP